MILTLVWRVSNVQVIVVVFLFSRLTKLLHLIQSVDESLIKKYIGILSCIESMFWNCCTISGLHRARINLRFLLLSQYIARKFAVVDCVAL